MAKLRDGLLLVLWGLTTGFMFWAIHRVFVFAPEEKVMGAVQKIFYFHVPSAMATYAAVAVLLAGSMGYLWTRKMVWDNLSRSATEVGLLFCTLVLITGPIWAKPAWGTWWTWEARLTSSLVLWLLLAACLMVRNYASNRELGARLASVVALVAALDVYIIHKAVEWWRGQHPVVFEPGKKRSIAPEMAATLGWCMGAFFLLFALLLWMRFRAADLEDRSVAAAERAAIR